MPYRERGADGAARVARGGLDPEVVVDARFVELPVRDAVQRDAARQAEIFRARRLLRVAGHLQDDLLGHVLDRAREIHLALRELRLGRPRGTAEEPLEAHAGHREAIGEVEVVHVEPDRAVGTDMDELLPDEIGVLRLAVGSEAHELVLATVDLEAAVVGEGRVQEADGVRELELREHLEPASTAHSER